MYLPSRYVVRKTAKVTILAAVASISISTGIRLILGAQADTITVIIRLILPFLIAIPIGLIWFRRMEQLERSYRLVVKHANELARTASTDPLTGLLNRRAFIEQFDGARAIGVNGWFLIADIDDLKIINDTHGHVVGDEAVVAASEALQQVLPSDSLIGRIGGDEFCAFVRQNTNSQLKVLNASLNLVSSKTFAKLRPDINHSLSMSVGLSECKGKAGFSEMMDQADENLYRKKRKRKLQLSPSANIV